MANDVKALGNCPHCGHNITPAYLLIEYERSNGERGAYAECPECEDVVSPQ